MNEKRNMILNTDAYKMTHWMQYPQGTRHIYSHMESRGSDLKELMFFGLQYFMKKYLTGVVVTSADIDHAEEFCKGLFGNDQYFNRSGWQRIVDVHGGKLPLRIRAVDEGTWVPVREVMMTIENTDPDLPWLTNWAESMLMKLWYPISVATYSGEIARLIKHYAEETGGTLSPVHLNDFGYRSASSEESAGIGGMAHIVNYIGTDNLLGIQYAIDYYYAKHGVGMSVLASEHSTTTSHGQENECKAFEQFIDSTADGGIVSIVIDSYDPYKAVDQFIGIDLIEKIKSGGKRVVLRPDSGDPLEQVSYILRSLERSFECEKNAAGYKLLPECVGIIYGDFMSYEMIEKICQWMLLEGWAIDGRNVVFGMGGNLLQNTNRDTHKFAIKCSAMMDGDGVWHDVFKDPKTMAGKASKPGRFSLVNTDSGMKTVPFGSIDESADLLKVVFENGCMKRHQVFDSVRKLASGAKPC